MEVLRTTEYFDPFLNKPLSVALAARTPHSRSLALVEQAELDSAAVRDDTHLSSQRINLTHDLSLCDTAYGRIATHLRDLVHVHRDQQGLTAHAGSCTRRFTTGMTGADYYHIVSEIHIIYLFSYCDDPTSTGHYNSRK